MNTNNLKRFAREARRKLIQQVGAKLEQVLHTDTAELREKSGHLRKLREAINETSREQVIDKVAYTWFNRLMALRYMDANDFQPIGIKVITPKQGYTLPELLDEAKQGHIPDELPVKAQHIYDLLDGRISAANAQNEAYKELLIGACNHLNKIFPFLFERIDDYTELLLPDDLISEFSIVHDVRQGMTTEDCSKVEIIGWLYQFYISEKKDEVFASKSKVKKEDIPAATQLFTPRWIVEYMVQNTVGKLWLQNRPGSRLREHMPYFIDSPSLHSSDYLKINSIEELTLLDQACGSGHILVYGFDLFAKIYEEEGYNPSEIPQLILQKNLFGFEIDERAAQLAGFALLMKARQYQRRVFRKEIKPNITCFVDLHLSDEEIKETFKAKNIAVPETLMSDLELMRQATNLGSLIVPETPVEVLEKLNNTIEGKKVEFDIFFNHNEDYIQTALSSLSGLSRRYHCVVDNPPYMGGGAMNPDLATFVKKHYPDSKADLMAAFMEAGIHSLMSNGYLGMINQHSWMFLSSYKNLRTKLINNVLFDTLLHLGPRTFPEIGGEVVQNASFTFWLSSGRDKGSFVRLVDDDNSELKRTKTLEAIQNPNCGWFYTANQQDFNKIPGSPIGYWLGIKVLNLFLTETSLKDLADPSQGLATTKNDLFIKRWSEIEVRNIGFNLTQDEAKHSSFKWFPVNKGGSFRKWFGNMDLVINYENNGKTLCDFIDNTPGVTVKSNGRVINRHRYFTEGLTWSTISSSAFSMRYSPVGSIFETKGAMCFLEDKGNLWVLLGYMNTKIVNYLLKVISPTLDYHEGPLGKLPVPTTMGLDMSTVIKRVMENVEFSKQDWDSHETSWDFLLNELLRINGQDLEETYDLYQQYWKNKFYQLHKNEEELNHQFIEIYGLQDELTPDVPLEDITILKEETSIVNNELVFHADEVMAQFVSYAVGCMFGRYSLDKEGLILANQGENMEDYINKVFINNSSEPNKDKFLPDEDNIIPILDDEWFEDDIVGRFHEFLKASFGKENFEKNLHFIEDALGKDMRKYFNKDFYADHIKRYKKRPIYWMFSSPKGSFNVLIYMHRYTPDTLNVILNNYLREYREKLNAHLEQLDHLMVSGSSSEQNKASKEKDKLRLILMELQEYERDLLYPLASERIAIDLDDGVLVNYNKFGKVIKEVAGLNDAKTKKKVREFDWIDTSTIR